MCQSFAVVILFVSCSFAFVLSHHQIHTHIATFQRLEALTAQVGNSTSMEVPSTDMDSPSETDLETFLQRVEWIKKAVGSDFELREKWNSRATNYPTIVGTFRSANPTLSGSHFEVGRIGTEPKAGYQPNRGTVIYQLIDKRKPNIFIMSKFAGTVTTNFAAFLTLTLSDQACSIDTLEVSRYWRHRVLVKHRIQNKELRDVGLIKGYGATLLALAMTKFESVNASRKGFYQHFGWKPIQTMTRKFLRAVSWVIPISSQEWLEYDMERFGPAQFRQMLWNPESSKLRARIVPFPKG